MNTSGNMGMVAPVGYILDIRQRRTRKIGRQAQLDAPLIRIYTRRGNSQLEGGQI